VTDPALLQEFLSGGEHLRAMQMLHPHMALDAARLHKRFVRCLFDGASGTCPPVLKQVLIFRVYVAAGGPAETIESLCQKTS
jgi:hypothetical protein